MNNKNIAERIWQKIDYEKLEILEKNNGMDWLGSEEDYKNRILNLWNENKEEEEIIEEIQEQVLNYYKKSKNDLELLKDLKKLEFELLNSFITQKHLDHNIKELLSTYKELDLKNIFIDEITENSDYIRINLNNKYFSDIIIAYDFFGYDEENNIKFIIKFIELDD